MSVFDGLAGTLNAVFGAPVTITPETGDPVTVRGILRELPQFEDDADRRQHFVAQFALQVPRPVPAALAKGATVTHESGRSFIVLGVFPDRSPAADAFMVAHLEEAP